MDRSPSLEEAAAIVAAVERFVAETAAQSGGEEGVGSWQRAALLEGVGAKETVQDSKGGERWLS